MTGSQVGIDGGTMRVGVLSALLLVAAPVPTSAASLQQEYEAAQAALDKKDYSVAAAGFEKLLAKYNKATDLTNRTAALLRARLGAARFRGGDAQGAIEPLEVALVGLQRKEDRDDRLTVLIDLGKARAALLDYSTARTHFEKVLQEVGHAGEAEYRDALIPVRIALARALLFDDPEAAKRQLDVVIPQLEAAIGTTGDVIGEIYSLRGRVEIMAGRNEEALAWFERGVNAAGGLGRKVSLYDLRVRGDMALANQLLGRKEAARKYLAYTGAGRLEENNIELGADMPLPPCAPAGVLQPDDVAIIEFSIGDDGRVTSVTPVYANRTGPVALEFARAVAGWSWTADAVAKLNVFWRAAVRLELRCATGGPRIDIVNTFLPVLDRWYAERGLSVPSTVNSSQSDAVVAAHLRAELAAREEKVGQTDTSLVPLLVSLGVNHAVSDANAKVFLGRAEAIASAADAPPDALTLLRILQLRREKRLGQMNGKDFKSLLDMLEQKGATQSRGKAWVLQEFGVHLEFARKREEAREQYSAVLAYPETVLPTDDLIRQTVVMRLASLEAAAKRFDKADALLQTAGLSPEQCALINVTPVAKSAYLTSEDFPREALSWGFEGWVKVSYDIDADGRVQNPRTVAAYPPFVFGPATVKGVKSFRYRPIYQAGKNLGCNGYEQRVNYSIRQ